MRDAPLGARARWPPTTAREPGCRRAKSWTGARPRVRPRTRDTLYWLAVRWLRRAWRRRPSSLVPSSTPSSAWRATGAAGGPDHPRYRWLSLLDAGARVGERARRRSADGVIRRSVLGTGGPPGDMRCPAGHRPDVLPARGSLGVQPAPRRSRAQRRSAVGRPRSGAHTSTPQARARRLTRSRGRPMMMPPDRSRVPSGRGWRPSMARLAGSAVGARRGVS